MSFWDQLDDYFESFSARQGYMTEAIAKIVTSTKSAHSRALRLAWMPDYMDIKLFRAFKETVRVRDGKLCSLVTGYGYYDPGALAERTYSMRDGVKYNLSEWKILNVKQLG